MAKACDIRRGGRLARLVAGLVLVGSGVGLYAADVPAAAWGRFLQAAMVVVGVFSLVEAVRGWCALRAMGIRTPW